MRKFIDNFSRFFVGGLFIFSGLIKLNDPIGTEIKLEEYFEVFGQDFGSFFLVFKPYALEIGMFLIVLEVVLGVAVLINYRMDNHDKNTAGADRVFHLPYLLLGLLQQSYRLRMLW